MPQKPCFTMPHQHQSHSPTLSLSLLLLSLHKTPFTPSPQKPNIPFSHFLHHHLISLLQQKYQTPLIKPHNQTKLSRLIETQMPSDSSDQQNNQNRRPAKAQTPGAPPPEQEHLPCPRCDSTNTKFCYYNNYNFSQPRHFCKSCRRYWTHGGTLRDIPVGGGTRKNAKRSRTTSSSAMISTTATSSLSDHPIPPTPVFMNPGGAAAFGDLKGNVGNGCGGASFTSLLNTQGPGFLALGGFGLGLANGFEEMGFGLGRAVWPFPGVGDGGAGVGGNGGGHGMMNTWQFESGEGGGIVNVGVGSVGGEFCSWPELAISTPGNGLK
ncbi:hypothetical protein ACE6H2_024505 [Prunus campanulata]